jgi:hypothetical protein
MSISLFCYTTLSENDASTFAQNLKAKRADFFASKFLLSKVRAVNDIEREIAEEHGLTPSSRFLVSLNDKNAAADLKAVARSVIEAFGADSVLILFENETPYGLS